MAGELRYFEVAPGGFSTLERHEHMHAVLILRGRGHCLVGDEVKQLETRDLVTVPPMTWHQFRATTDEPLGFLCMVDAQRDKPQLPDAGRCRAAAPRSGHRGVPRRQAARMTSNSNGPVLWDIDARGVATVTLNRPEVNNAYNGAMIDGLLAALDALGSAKGLRAVVLKGNGKHFQAGADLKWINAVRKSLA